MAHDLVEERMVRYAVARALDALPIAVVMRACVTMFLRSEQCSDLSEGTRAALDTMLDQIPQQPFPGAPGAGYPFGAQ